MVRMAGAAHAAAAEQRGTQMGWKGKKIVEGVEGVEFTRKLRLVCASQH